MVSIEEDAYLDLGLRRALNCEVKEAFVFAQVIHSNASQLPMLDSSTPAKLTKKEDTEIHPNKLQSIKKAAVALVLYKLFVFLALLLDRLRFRFRFRV